MITLNTTIKAPVATCWKLWTTAADIMQWNNPTEEWCTPRARIDLREGGSFLFRMETKDGSMGFDHGGKYDKVVAPAYIEYTGSDGRKSIIRFAAVGNETTLSETFEPEAETPVDIQKDFVQGVLDNFKRYAERGK